MSARDRAAGVLGVGKFRQLEQEGLVAVDRQNLVALIVAARGNAVTSSTMITVATRRAVQALGPHAPDHINGEPR